jgi:biopolymer transport protein ExbD
MRFKRRLKANFSVEMTPMIDAVFLLLIFFMVTSSVIKDPGILVNLPRAQSAESQPDKDLIITIKEDSMIYLNDEKVSRDQLFDTLKKLQAQHGRDFLIVRGDEVIPYKSLVEVMDTARLAGFVNVTLATRR